MASGGAAASGHAALAGPALIHAGPGGCLVSATRPGAATTAAPAGSAAILTTAAANTDHPAH